ncbi:Bromodomain-containing protein [Coprinopsis sp. MPI-PUGE-AT-0042]|nr:Bromodomain-containing protein [Coprinopsis sp. MPI-PUGE-AT-0042]
MEAAEEVPEDKDDEQDAAEEATREESEAKEEEKASSGEDEPPQTIRRSTRRKSSASTAPPLPKRNRRQQRDVTPQPAAEAEDAGDTPRTDENPSSSPFETPTRTREGKRKASTLDTLDSGGRDSKRQRDDSEFPEDDDQLESPAAHNTRSRPTRGGGRSEEHLAIKRFQSVIGFVYSQISQHRNGTIFHNPIKPSEAPDYHEVVKKPIDLKTIKARIKDGLISNSLEFQRDIYLMFANAMMYNRPGSDVYTMAGDMMIDAETWIHDFRQTEGYIRAGHR